LYDEKIRGVFPNSAAAIDFTSGAGCKIKKSTLIFFIDWLAN
jgi:hypothetical protein